MNERWRRSLILMVIVWLIYFVHALTEGNLLAWIIFALMGFIYILTADDDAPEPHD